MTDGWVDSAEAWIADMERGDFSREFVLDAPMLSRACASKRDRALDVGCGEGRFCRILRKERIDAVGIDPTPTLIERARELDPTGDYRLGRAEALDFPAQTFDLVVSYLTLIDIDDAAAAIAEMTRVLRPGGSLLIANVQSFTSGGGDYFSERAELTEWRGIRVRNWHRPLSRYMELLLAQGLRLCCFEEPQPTGGDPATAERYRHAPWHYIMEWERPRDETTLADRV
jgi:SAM-dependent methyltransferase